MEQQNTMVLKILKKKLKFFKKIYFFFSAVHSVCLWDDKGPQKMYKALQDDILDFIRHAQAVSAFFKTFFLQSCLLQVLSY